MLFCLDSRVKMRLTSHVIVGKYFQFYNFETIILRIDRWDSNLQVEMDVLKFLVLTRNVP